MNEGDWFWCKIEETYASSSRCMIEVIRHTADATELRLWLENTTTGDRTVIALLDVLPSGLHIKAMSVHLAARTDVGDLARVLACAWKLVHPNKCFDEWGMIEPFTAHSV